MKTRSYFVFAIVLVCNFFLLNSCTNSLTHSKMFGNPDPLLEKIRVQRFINLGRDYKQTINMPYNPNANVGSGINAYGKVFPSPFDPKSKKVEALPHYAKSDQRFCLTRTREENERETAFTAGMEVCGSCFEVSGSLSIMNKAVIDESSINGYICHAYESSEKNVMGDPRLTTGSLNILKEKGIDGFIKIYGTHYVKGFINAASFFGEARIFIEDKDVAKSIAGQIQGELNKIKENPFYESNEKSFLSKYKANCFASIRGLEVNEYVFSLEDLLFAYKKFIQVANKDKKPQCPYLLICQPWINLPEVAEVDGIFDQYNSLEKSINEKIEFTVYEEMENFFSVFRYKDALDLLLSLKTLHSLPKFIKKLDDDKKNKNWKK